MSTFIIPVLHNSRKELRSVEAFDAISAINKLRDVFLKVAAVAPYEEYEMLSPVLCVVKNSR